MGYIPTQLPERHFSSSLLLPSPIPSEHNYSVSLRLVSSKVYNILASSECHFHLSLYFPSVLQKSCSFPVMFHVYTGRFVAIPRMYNPCPLCRLVLRSIRVFLMVMDMDCGVCDDGVDVNWLNWSGLEEYSELKLRRQMHKGKRAKCSE